MSFPVIVNTEDFRNGMKDMKAMALKAPVYIRDAKTKEQYIFASKGVYEAEVAADVHDRLVAESFERGMNDIANGNCFVGTMDEVLTELHNCIEGSK